MKNILKKLKFFGKKVWNIKNIITLFIYLNNQFPILIDVLNTTTKKHWIPVENMESLKSFHSLIIPILMGLKRDLTTQLLVLKSTSKIEKNIILLNTQTYYII